ncbi:MAG TPA: Crp/Fnr family transcriptional regulator [Candidatus Acidoferrales bacterium]
MKITRSEKDFFDPRHFLATEGAGRQLREFRRGGRIFSQGEPAESLMYIQKGGVKFHVVNSAGKEAVVAIYGPGDFVGVGCMGGQPVRMGTATAMTPATVLAIGKKEMLRALHNEPRLSDHFIEYMIGRNARMEANLVDQLFNPCEKRLARTLLLLAGSGTEYPQTDSVLPKVSQKTLAAMIGTTRSRVNFFMNKFRRLGFIECNGKIKINKTLLAITLREHGSRRFPGETPLHRRHSQNFRRQPANAMSAAGSAEASNQLALRR